MGIGVSFTGHGGKRRDFELDDVPKPGEAADRLLGDASSRVREALAMLPGRKQDKEEAKLHPRGSIVMSPEGICLKGEQSRVPRNGEIYSQIKGERGFHTLQELDPKEQAARLGDIGIGKENADTGSAKDGEAVLWQTLTGLSRETDNLGRMWLVQYERDQCKTKSGRIVGVSEERRTVVCELPQGGGSGYGGMALFAYDEATHTIAGGAYCFARRYYQVSGVTVTQGGEYRLKVSMGRTRSAVIESGSGFSTPSTDYAYVPLYTFDSNLRVTADWRGAPQVQAWE